jgi:RNA polymerase sigma factor (sigma-70 family)
VSGEDADIIRRCLAGDERAYRELVQRFQRPVFNVAMRMVRRTEDAEDLTQETFVRMFRALDRYDPERPFSAWLFTIATRLCIDHIRRKRLAPISMFQAGEGAGDEYVIEAEDPGLKPDESTSHAEEEQRTKDLIESLPPHYRIVVLLRHQQDLSYDEIAETLQMPLGTVKARIHRARELMKQRIAKSGS